MPRDTGPDGKYFVTWNRADQPARARKRVYARKSSAVKLGRTLAGSGDADNVRVFVLSGEDISADVPRDVPNADLASRIHDRGSANRTRGTIATKNRELAKIALKSPRATRAVDKFDALSAPFRRSRNPGQ